MSQDAFKTQFSLKASQASQAESRLKDHLLGVMHQMPDDERDMMRFRFGLDVGQPRTLEEVGRAFGVTRERIRQIESKAIRKLRRPTFSRHLQDYLE